MQGTKIYMAGGEVDTLARALLDNGVTRILWSYFYIMSMRREHQLAQYMEQNPHISFFLDSGAFTYFTKWSKDAKKLPHYEQYVERYFQYIDEYGHLYDRIAEPDLDNTIPGIGSQHITEWRNDMLNNFEHLNITPVWHSWRGKDDWDTYLFDDRIKTLAIGRQPGEPGLQRKMVLAAKKAGKPVHGFAQTKINTLLKWVPYDSVDSTSWLTGQQYGTMYVFKGNKFVTLSTANDGKRKRKLYRTYFKAIGCDYKKIEADDVAEVRKANVIAWRNLNARLEQIQKHRGGEGDERGAAIEREQMDPAEVTPVAKPGILSELFSSASAPREREDAQSSGPRDREVLIGDHREREREEPTERARERE